MTTPTERVFIDLSSLPEVAFGKRSLSWWATTGFIAIEGTTLVVLLSSFLYLRTNWPEWPPRVIDSPGLLYPTLQLGLQLLAVWPAVLVRQAAHHMDRARVTRWMMVMTLMGLVACVVRALEFTTLSVKWDVNAYGSALWGSYVAHTSLMVADTLECAVMWFFFGTGRNTRRFYSDAEDGAEYQFFLTAAWVLCYVILIIGPRAYL